MTLNARLQDNAEQVTRVGRGGGQAGENRKGRRASPSVHAPCKGLSDATGATWDRPRRAGALKVAQLFRDAAFDEFQANCLPSRVLGFDTNVGRGRKFFTHAAKEAGL